jgi:similar to stage IV sporulation protein
LLLLRLWNYIHGYVIIIVTGYFLEKFINVCLHRHIRLWDVERLSDNKMRMKISIKGFKLLRPIARKTRCKVRINGKEGLPFFFNRYRKRKTFLAGLVLFFVLIYLMSSFVWSIEITGNENIETEQIEEFLDACGIKTGVFKYKINAQDAADQLMLDVKELSWVSIELVGTKVKIDLRERIPIPEIIPLDEPCNIVAKKDGVIKSILVKEGIEEVSEGDTVKKGDLLISGKIPVKNEEDTFRKVHSIGTVEARTWYEESCEVKTEIIEETRTGSVQNNYSVVFFSKILDFFQKNIEYENYESDYTVKKLKLGDNHVYPIGIGIDRYFELDSKTVEIDIEEAMSNAVESALSNILARIPENAEIVDNNVEIESAENGETIARVTVECLEDIGVQEPIKEQLLEKLQEEGEPQEDHNQE